MTTKREQILAKVKTILTSTTGINKRIYRNRVEPFAREESPSIVVEFSSDNPSLRNRDFIDWTLSIRVIVICRHKNPDTKADATVESLHTKLVADQTLGGLAIDVRPLSVDFQSIEADTPAGIYTCNYEIDYRSTYNDLSTWFINNMITLYATFHYNE